MGMPRFTAEFSLSYGDKSYQFAAGSGNPTTTFDALHDREKVSPQAWITDPECYDDCLNGGGSPRSCFLRCRRLAPM